MSNPEDLGITIVDRSGQKSQTPFVVWFTGLSGAGKSTIANLLEAKLHAQGQHTYLLDGDKIRSGLNRDIGFSAEDRAESVRRTAEVASLMLEAGLIVVVALISPFEADRVAAKKIIGEERFYEIYVSTPLDIAEKRDTKGLYKKARLGLLKNFTGIDSPYEVPLAPALTVFTQQQSAQACALAVFNFLLQKPLA